MVLRAAQAPEEAEYAPDRALPKRRCIAELGKGTLP